MATFILGKTRLGGVTPFLGKLFWLEVEIYVNEWLGQSDVVS